MTCSPGAGHYLRTDKVTGKGVKRSMSARHKEGIHAGYPNPLVQPVDTYGRWGIVLEFILCAVTILHRMLCFCAGFATPDPNYCPASVRGPEYSCGRTIMKKDEGVTIGPGRIEVYINTTNVSLALPHRRPSHLHPSYSCAPITLLW